MWSHEGQRGRPADVMKGSEQPGGWVLHSEMPKLGSFRDNEASQFDSGAIKISGC